MSGGKRHGLPPPGYRRGVGLAMFNRQGLVFAAKRIDTPGDAWQMPQGGIDRGETPIEAALRELKEEVGTNDVAVLAETAEWLRYDLPPDLASRLWGGRFRGQAQKWFALRFTGRDDDIELAASRHPEFSEWTWMPLDELTKCIVPFKRAVYRAVAAEFGVIARRLAEGSS